MSASLPFDCPASARPLSQDGSIEAHRAQAPAPSGTTPVPLAHGAGALGYGAGITSQGEGTWQQLAQVPASTRGDARSRLQLAGRSSSMCGAQGSPGHGAAAQAATADGAAAAAGAPLHRTVSVPAAGWYGVHTGRAHANSAPAQDPHLQPRHHYQRGRFDVVEEGHQQPLENPSMPASQQSSPSRLGSGGLGQIAMADSVAALAHTGSISVAALAHRPQLVPCSAAAPAASLPARLPPPPQAVSSSPHLAQLALPRHPQPAPAAAAAGVSIPATKSKRLGRFTVSEEGGPRSADALPEYPGMLASGEGSDAVFAPAPGAAGSIAGTQGVWGSVGQAQVGARALAASQGGGSSSGNSTGAGRSAEWVVEEARREGRAGAAAGVDERQRLRFKRHISRGRFTVVEEASGQPLSPGGGQGWEAVQGPQLPPAPSAAAVAQQQQEREAQDARVRFHVEASAQIRASMARNRQDALAAARNNAATAPPGTHPGFSDGSLESEEVSEESSEEGEGEGGRGGGDVEVTLEGGMHGGRMVVEVIVGDDGQDQAMVDVHEEGHGSEDSTGA